MPTDHGHVIARFHKADEATVAKGIEAAMAAKPQWEALPWEDRAAIFQRAGDLVASKYRYDLMAVTMLGTGKNVWQAEIDAAVETTDFLRLNNTYAEFIYAQQPPLNSPNTWNRIEYRPLEGFVSAISPFNFLAIGANLPGAPALMGNTVVWKPSSTAILGNYMVQQIFQEAGVPAGVINFLPSEGTAFGNPTMNHPDFAALHFTGSTGVFNHLWSQVGNNLPKYKSYPRIVGETGGKNFHLMHPSAHADVVAMNTIRAAFEYQGQKCSACSRLYVPESKWPAVKAKMLEILGEAKQGCVTDFESFTTAVIDRKSFDKISQEYIEYARGQPDCEIIAGGEYDDSKGYFIKPTIIETTNPHTKSMQEEIFGPVLTAYVYPDAEFEETCALIDTTTPYALTGSLFCQDRYAAVKGANLLKNAAGNFYINDKSTGAVVGEQPFGGARASGTNDKAGSYLNLLRWVSPRTIKENTVPITDWKYPHMAPGN